jgi:Predicted periplasmic ligand-binding sensor domain
MKNTIHKCFVLVVILFSCLPVGGQSSYLFHHLQTSDGLSNSHINAILKDSYGFLWIGTESGLNRYDGYGFKVYSMRPNVPNTLLTNDIVGLSEDGLGNIWIDLGFCYMVYNRDKDCFISNIPNFLRRLSIVVDHNYKIYIDKNRDIWVLTNRKMFYLDTKRKALKEFRIKMGKASLSSIHISDDIENLYLIDGDGLLNQIAKKNGCLTPIVLPKTIRAEILNHSNVIYADSYNGLWLYSNKSELVYYRENMSPTWKKINLFSAINTQTNIVQSIFDDENGHVWIGTDHKGAFLYDRYKGTITNIHHDPSLYTTISSNNVDCIYRDNTGTMWLGHYKNGISCFNESFQYLVNIQFAECRDINAILEDKKGNIWFGTDGNGLFVKNAATNAIRQFQMPNWVIVTLLEDRQGRIWIGTYQNGLFCYENGRITQFTVKNSELSDNDVWDLQEDTYGKLWVAPLGGKVQRLNPDTKKFEALDSPNTEVDNPQNIYYAGGEILYVGTSYGLCVKNVISGKKTVCLGNSRGNQQFKQQFISAIYKDRRGILWLGHSQGMTAWDLKKDTLYYIDKESGLCDNIIRGIVEDSYGNLVVTTSNGLSILSVEKDKYGCFAFACRNFSVKDGLKDNYFNSHSICKLRNGIVLMGGTDGYTLINSNKIAEKNQPLAKIIFTGLKVGNKVIQVDSIYNGHKILEHSLEQISMLTFNYDDKLITLYFTTGDLLTADKVKYMYQLEGFSNQWLPTHDNKIEFSTLPPGTYRLLIKACNSDGIWNDNPTILTIRVKLPIYLSWWAIILYILIAGMLVLYSIRRTKRLNYNKLQQQKLQLEHEQAIYLNETKLKFFTNISHDLRTPLTLITTPIQILLDEITDEKLHKILRTMHKNAEQLMTTDKFSVRF